MRVVLREAWPALGLALVAAITGCGTPGAPQPPSLNLPDRVVNLTATRTGNQVSLTWTMPKRNTDKLQLKMNVPVRICRREGTGACETAGAGLMLAPGAPGDYTDALPAMLAESEPRALSYFVELKNKNGRSAGLSNEAVVLAGKAPGTVEGLRAEAIRDGVELHWAIESADQAVRLQRTLLTRAKPNADAEHGPLGAEKEPAEQNLLIENGARAGGAIDRTARVSETYEYRAQRVARVEVDGKTVELDGELSAPVRVDVKDVFPPGVPTGLAAVATAPEPGVATGPAIDLSWQPVTDPDIAGYIVYRREGDSEWARISGEPPVAGPAFHDAGVTAGHTYRYAVSAIGKNGHESARSAPAEETVPN